MVALLVLMASAAHASLEEGPLALRRSQGRGRDNPKCIEPPPPLRGDLSAQRKSGEAAPSHLKYLALDGSTDTAQSDWTNLGFIGPTPAGIVNETELQTVLDLGYDMFLSMQGITVQTCIWGTNAEVVHSVASTPPSPFKSTERRPATAHSPLCPERWQAAWTGPNATVGGIWNNSIEKLAKEKKLIGVYLGDELLGGGLTVSNLTAITKMVKAVWPEGIVYYNEEWTPFNDPDWKDSEGQVRNPPSPRARSLLWPLPVLSLLLPLLLLLLLLLIRFIRSRLGCPSFQIHQILTVCSMHCVQLIAVQCSAVQCSAVQC